ncbi:hypothetical protein PR202_gb10451 [Eleusine coracana subsp. coracana]|uniref:60S ribosomal protein L36 n=1 Tax=Eleusine coracana subsp. coracana TaxID=191504 RepID=A0AAV5EK04_ELECO|nr:hypothetical protein PR202_gb10451 [Eleusine coracana subsp. coracana]
MAPPPAKTGLFVGPNKGHVVTKRKLPPRPSDRKGRVRTATKLPSVAAILITLFLYYFKKTSKRNLFVRLVIKEVAGLAPYEKRIVELLRFCKDKRALKVAKRKLGTHKRAKKKREDLINYLRKRRYASTFHSCILGENATKTLKRTCFC